MHERKRIDMRVSQDERARIEQAARAAGKTLTQFILDAVRAKVIETEKTNPPMPD